MGNAHCTTIDEAMLGASTAPPHCRVTVEADFSTRQLSTIRHNYHLHPLMRLDRLEQLAQSLLATKQCRFTVPGTTDASTFHHNGQPADGRSLEEVFQRIHEPGSWLALYNVETDPEYGRFVWEVLNSAGPPMQEDPVWDVRGFIFISAPPSATPFHIDREQNIWLQIRGRKTISVWDHRDRETVAASDVEDFISCGTLENVRLTDAARSRARNFDCGPGDGVFFPNTSPHLTNTYTSGVTPDDGVVISMGVVFSSNSTRRAAYAHAFNHVLRRLGMNPDLAGSNDWIDRIKYPLGRAVVALRRRFRGYTPPPGF